jgi:hypothetical protein
LVDDLLSIGTETSIRIDDTGEPTKRQAIGLNGLLIYQERSDDRD